VRIIHADARCALPDMAAASVDACVCDPPYGLNFMGKKWDGGDAAAFDPAFWVEVLRVLKPGAHLVAFGGTRTYHRLVCAIEDAGFEIRDQLAWLFGSGFPKSHNQPGGWGTALKPAHEPILLGRKPLIGTVAANMNTHGTGALNIDASRIETEGERRMCGTTASSGQTSIVLGAREETSTTAGRWPANVIHDGSEEVLRGFPETESGALNTGKITAPNKIFGARPHELAGEFAPNGGSAARFFYTAKADASDRLESKHPTVKPVDLMAYLIKLVTPPGGVVLDPFAGSGTTGMACMREGFQCILIEREAEYVEDIHRRLAHVSGADTPLFRGGM